jgi:hypothetical protein
MLNETKATVLPPGKGKTTVGAQQLMKVAPKILHSKECLEGFCETPLKIRTFALILPLEQLTVAQTQQKVMK